MRRLAFRRACGVGLVAAALAVAVRRGARRAELRQLLAGLDGPAPPPTYRELVDTDGDPPPEDGPPPFPAPGRAASGRPPAAGSAVPPRAR